jgi:hypothetical protein
MLSSYPGMFDYVNLAFERHKALIEDARRQRECWLACRMAQERPMRWRGFLHRMRNRVGDLLVYWGQRLKTDVTNDETKTVWG